MVKLGFSLENQYALPMAQVLDLLVKVGFSAVSVSWKRDSSLAQTILMAKERGLMVQSIHGPIRTVANLWSHDQAIAQPALQDFLDAATDCANFGVPTLVVHTWYGKNYTFCKEDLCFDSFDTLIAHAERLGVAIAFEHLEGPEYFAALMDRFQAHPTVGFCWDSGHECCYNPGWDFLRHYGHRLNMTHLNDNMGLSDPTGRLVTTDDVHLIPGDGIIDWTAAMADLKASRRQEILNLELKIRPHGDRCTLDLYSQLPLEDFLCRAYQSACRIVGDYFDQQP